ncbi:hypothetical protein R3W88_027673 [Solanum pinnatisectum]|uniref:DNA-directed RNA polymerase insert domain-containing protein n=1 Tax=Solanum pinnatisectum TaxID=50273 RepID=A0AAV9LJJ7_9SOLN|nr:hypothetical protein R3W88_027673 [Solanum pinnatisectum]
MCWDAKRFTWRNRRNMYHMSKYEKLPHEYSTITGIQESVNEILMNLKEIVLRSNLYGPSHVSTYVKDRRYVTAQDITLPPYVEMLIIHNIS